MIDGLYCPDLHHLVLQDCLGLPRNSFSEFFFLNNWAESLSDDIE